MIDDGTTGGPTQGRRRSVGLQVLGLLSLALFFVPLVAPFLQVVTLVFVAVALRHRAIDTLSLALAAGGALLGLVLHLLTQYVWIV
jgi:hypothetical protein